MQPKKEYNARFPGPPLIEEGIIPYWEGIIGEPPRLIVARMLARMLCVHELQLELSLKYLGMARVNFTNRSSNNESVQDGIGISCTKKLELVSWPYLIMAKVNVNIGIFVP